jgi:Retroviral aspartyl protease
MIRYLYNRQFTPPAPFVHVTIRGHTGIELTDLPAQLDPGADRTLVPYRFIEELQLIQLDELSIQGLGGQVISLPTFTVQMQIRHLNFVTLKVTAHKNEPFVLLGRDILNQYRLLLDGPQLALEIG